VVKFLILWGHCPLHAFDVNFGKLALDVTKLVFASLVLGTVIKGDFPQTTLLVVGIITSGAGAIFGIKSPPTV
jgi:hypothetical protein